VAVNEIFVPNIGVVLLSFLWQCHSVLLIGQQCRYVSSLNSACFFFHVQNNVRRSFYVSLASKEEKFTNSS
jgi:hypothetical protein